MLLVVYSIYRLIAKCSVVSFFSSFRPDARLNATSGFPTFATQLLVNHLERRRDIQMNEMTEEDLQIIHRLSKNKHIREKIIDSIAPSLYGHRLIKTGLAYSMFGGVQRFTSGNHLIRGDINFLILGSFSCFTRDNRERFYVIPSSVVMYGSMTA